MAGRSEAMAHDLREILRVAAGRGASPPAVLEGRTLQSTPESGARAEYDGAKRRNGSKVPVAVLPLPDGPFHDQPRTR